MTTPQSLIGRLVLGIGGPQEGTRGAVIEATESDAGAVRLSVRVRREFHVQLVTILLSDAKFID